MTNRKQEKIETPVNADTYKETALFQSNEILLANDTENEVLKAQKKQACYNIIQVFKGLTAKNYDEKHKQIFLDANFTFRANKETKAQFRKDVKTLTPTATTVVSLTKRYILAGNEVNEKTTYIMMKDEFKPTISDDEKDLNKQFKSLKVNRKKLALDLLKAHEKEVADIKQAEFEAKKLAENKAKNDEIVNTTINRKKPATNKKKKGAMAGATA